MTELRNMVIPWDQIIVKSIKTKLNVKAWQRTGVGNKMCMKLFKNDVSITDFHKSFFLEK